MHQSDNDALPYDNDPFFLNAGARETSSQLKKKNKNKNKIKNERRRYIIVSLNLVELVPAL
jgi:hypothetical protein